MEQVHDGRLRLSTGFFNVGTHLIPSVFNLVIYFHGLFK